jgi:hypothetical protein
MSKESPDPNADASDNGLDEAALDSVAGGGEVVLEIVGRPQSGAGELVTDHG